MKSTHDATHVSSAGPRLPLKVAIAIAVAAQLLFGWLPAQAAPLAPTNLTATVVAGPSIQLNWQNNAFDADGYIVVVRDPWSGLWIVIARVGSNVHSFVDSVSPGMSYKYKIRAYNSTGKSAPTNVVTVDLGNQPPVANAGAAQFTQTLTPIFFDGSGSYDPDGFITSYSWSFGDGATASGVTATHAFGTTGYWPVTLTVTDNMGVQSSSTIIVAVANRSPVANAGPPQTVSQNTSATFNGSSSSDPDGTIVSYSWTFGDGGSASGPVVNHTYTSTGSFTATLTVTDNSGASASATAAVTVTTTSNQGSGSIAWAKRAGSTGGDSGNAVTIDPSGNVLVAGAIKGGVDFGGGVINGTGSSAFIAKYNSSGGYLWAKRFDGTNGSSTAYGIATDPNTGNIFLTGSFMGTVDFGGGGLTSAGWPQVPNQDAFLAAFSPSGNYLWAVGFGGGLEDYGYGVAATPNGDVIVTGQIGGRLDMGCGIMATTSSSHDTFLARFSGSAGTCQWAKFIGGSAEDAGAGVAVTPSGDVVVAGYFQGTANFGGGPVTSAGLSDIYVAKYTGQGAYLWLKTVGGSGDDRATSVALDPSGNVVIGGYFSGTVNFGGGPVSSLGSWDPFVAKYSASGQYLWAKGLGGGSTDEAFGVDTDSSGNVVVVGGFQGTIDLGGGPLTSHGFWDAFVAKYRGSDGGHMWSKGLGGPYDDLAYAVAIDGSGNTFVTGYFQNSVAFDGTTLTSAGVADMFLISMQ